MKATSSLWFDLLDLISAFDTVDHPTLLLILQSRFSVTGQPLGWFRSYLTGRTQVFTTHSGHTLPVPLISGVHQGSSLGPAQFISYSPIYLVHGVYHHCLSLITFSPIPHVRWWYSVLRLLSNFWNSTTSSSNVVLYRLPCQVLRFIAVTTQPITIKDRVYLMVRLTHQSAKIPSSSRSLQICNSVVDCSEVVRDLGVFFDSEMSMKHNVSKTASACFCKSLFTSNMVDDTWQFKMEQFLA